MVSEALPVKHPCSPDSQRFTPKHSAAVRMHEEHCGFPNRSVSVASRVDLSFQELLAPESIFNLVIYLSTEQEVHLSFSYLGKQKVSLG